MKPRALWAFVFLLWETLGVRGVNQNLRSLDILGL